MSAINPEPSRATFVRIICREDLRKNSYGASRNCEYVKDMKPRKNRFVYLAGGLLVCVAAQGGRADSKPNPYQVIAERNPFGLKPPPPPPDNTPPPPGVPLGTVVLTGITSRSGPTPRALLEMTGQEAGKTGTVRKPILREGDRE